MRDRSTRLAVSVRDRAIAISFVMSSSPMVNSTTSRAAAILKASFSESPNKATMHRRKMESRSTQRFHGIAALEVKHARCSPPARSTDHYSRRSWRNIRLIGIEPIEVADYVAIARWRREDVEAYGGRQ